MDIAGLKKQHDELETAEEQADEGNMPAIGGEKDWDDAPDGACAAPDWGCSDEEDEVQDQDIPEESHQPNFQAAPEADHVPNCAAAAPPQLPSVPKPHSAAWYSKWALSTVEQDAWAPRRPPHAERYTRRLATNPKLQTRVMNDLKARNMGRQLSPHLLTDKWVAELHQEALEIARRIRLENQPCRRLFDELPPNPGDQLEVTREHGPKFLEDLFKRHKGELVELTSTWRAVHAPAPATGGARHVQFNICIENSSQRRIQNFFGCVEQIGKLEKENGVPISTK